MNTFNKFLYGFIPGLLLPVFVIWIYTANFVSDNLSFIQVLDRLYPSPLFGKLLFMSVMPNLGLVYVFYLTNSFRLASGLLLSVIPYIITMFLIF